MNFINTGLDDQILKSMDAEYNPSEDLVKAMNKTGLVQKEVQVKGKNGQTFTRKQWVKASKEQKTDSKSFNVKENQKRLYELVDYMESHSDDYGYQGDMKYPEEFDKILDDTPAGTVYKIPFNLNTKSYYVYTKKSDGGWDKSVEYYDMKNGVLGTEKITKPMHSYKSTSGVSDNIYSDAYHRKSNDIPEVPKNNNSVSIDKQGNTTDSVKFDKTKSGKVGGIQIGKELATVIKTVPSGAKKLREVTDKDTGKTYSIYTDSSSNKPDGIVAVENSTGEPIDEKNMKMMDKIKKETKFTSQGKILDALEEALNSSEDDNTDYTVESATVLSVEDYKGNGPKGAGTVDRIRIKAEVTGKTSKGEKFTKEVTVSTKSTKDSTSDSSQSVPKTKDEFTESGDGSFSSPLVISNGTQDYQIWAEGSHIKGSMVGKQDSRNVRDIFDFTNSGFDNFNFNEVKEYVKKHFFTKKTNTSSDSSKSISIPKTKDEIQKLVASGKSKDDIMKLAKDAGITWKEHDHAGINWMRACMAMTGTSTKGSK